MCCLKLGDGAVVTGISNTRQQLNWLCRPLSITNMHVQSFIRRINLLSFNGVRWGFWLCPCPSFFYFHLLLPEVLYITVDPVQSYTWFGFKLELPELKYLLVFHHFTVNCCKSNFNIHFTIMGGQHLARSARSDSVKSPRTRTAVQRDSVVKTSTPCVQGPDNPAESNPSRTFPPALSFPPLPNSIKTNTHCNFKGQQSSSTSYHFCLSCLSLYLFCMYRRKRLLYGCSKHLDHFLSILYPIINRSDFRDYQTCRETECKN